MTLIQKIIIILHFSILYTSIIDFVKIKVMFWLVISEVLIDGSVLQIQ